MRNAQTTDVAAWTPALGWEKEIAWVAELRRKCITAAPPMKTAPLYCAGYTGSVT